MKYPCKLTVFTLILVIVAGQSVVNAQMIPISSSRTPYGTVTVYQQMPSNYFNYGGTGSGSGMYGSKHKFTVVLANDTVVTVRSRINLGPVHFLDYKGTKIQVLKPADTKEIFCVSSSGRKITGMPADSCWLFKLGEGKINTYSYLAEDRLDYVSVIQDGDDGAIVPLTKDNLLKIVGSEDPKVLKLIDRDQPGKAIQLYNRKAAKEAKRTGKNNG